MINLLRAESKRLWARRMTRFFPAVLALLMIAGIVIAYLVIVNDDGNMPDFVDDIAGGTEATSLLGPVATLLPVMAFVIGASFIGADVKTGMLEQILTWEPRRLRLLSARTIVGVLSVGLLAVLLAVFLVGLLYGLAAATGTTDGTSSELWANVATSVVRTGAAAGLFFAFGLGITLLVNNSVGSIVGFVIYWFIVEGFLVAAFLPKVAVYLPVTNATAFAQGTPVQRIDGSVFGDFDLIDDHSYLMAGLILAGWTALALALSAVAFRRRDIA
jgi:ABC-type transport system involved in multi-copper enzyme maturation permease subunit